MYQPLCSKCCNCLSLFLLWWRKLLPKPSFRANKHATQSRHHLLFNLSLFQTGPLPDRATSRPGHLLDPIRLCRLSTAHRTVWSRQRQIHVRSPRTVLREEVSACSFPSGSARSSSQASSILWLNNNLTWHRTVQQLRRLTEQCEPR